MNASHRLLISVVLTTYQRRDLLAKALLSLACQTLGHENYEVIVIDDGSSPAARDVVAAIPGEFQCKYVYQPNVGLASAKNHGLFYCRAPLVLFLDDDDLSDSDLLARHVYSHRCHPDLNIAVLGRTKLSQAAFEDPLMSYVAGEGGHLFSYQYFPSAQFLDHSYFWGGRTSVKRRYLLSHGVFNPIFRFGFEDIELGYRLRASGLRVLYDDRAVNTMVRIISLDQYLGRCVRQGESASRFIDLYPHDPELPESLQLKDAATEWNLVEAAYEGLLRAARRLDVMVRLSADLDCEQHRHCRRIYESALSRAFRAATLKGFMDVRRLTA